MLRPAGMEPRVVWAASDRFARSRRLTRLRRWRLLRDAEFVGAEVSFVRLRELLATGRALDVSADAPSSSTSAKQSAPPRGRSRPALVDCTIAPGSLYPLESC